MPQAVPMLLGLVAVFAGLIAWALFFGGAVANSSSEVQIACVRNRQSTRAREGWHV